VRSDRARKVRKSPARAAAALGLEKAFEEEMDEVEEPDMKEGPACGICIEAPRTCTRLCDATIEGEMTK